MEEEEEGRVRQLIEKATDTTAPEVDPRLLKAIKSAVRHSDSELRTAARTLMSLMKRNHSQVRYMSLLIIDELFMRSKLFRTLIVENLDQLLSFSMGFRKNMPLPAPQAVASRLHSKAIEFLEKWNASFGVHYRQLRLGFDYCKNNLRLQFPDRQGNAARIQQERREREIRTQEILRKKFETLKESFPLIKEEIQSTVNEIEECLDIVTTKEEPVPLVPLDDEDCDDFRSHEILQLRLASLKEAEKVHEDLDNKVLFDALRELYRLLVTRHLVSVQQWITVVVKVDATDNRLRDSILKELINIQNKIQLMKRKCEELVSALPTTAKHDLEEEEDIWEEGKIEPSDNGSSTTLRDRYENPSVPSTSGLKSMTSGCSVGESVSIKASNESDDGKNPAKTKLLLKAPVMRWGPYLDNWGSNSGVLANQRGLDVESHWGRVDHDAVIPAEKIAELTVQATLYEEEQVNIKPCNAPLSSGGLCQRRDLKVCPFHGPIIPRDSAGHPLDQNVSADGRTCGLETDVAKQLAKQAVKNVRTRDREEIEKRIHDKQSLKRAKLAKIREHNEAVLREAALASTSRSAAIAEDIDSTDKPSSRKKKETLASMLRKKVTAKDRLSERLLNARTADATIRQLRSDEDSCYREAFPNQW
ncbi:UV-stimulated scaffold protein A homolog [Eucalyptus grandis]|uniref:UV-stimulated scaffold protein A homolog n=1 Tax=Eucalyptus grandis TaxID=71139 RepID=UPI00192EAB65|nr:UV-stimulated scaffold protein A homolog [Eucalyptus grandis]